MIDKEKLIKTIDSALEGTPMFLTDLTVTPDNNITVEVDSDEPVDIDACAALTRAIEESFDRDAEDYSLEVGSAGLTSPLKTRRQYLKYIGKDLEVLTRDGRKLRGVLREVAPGADSEPVVFTIEYPVKVKEAGAKKPVVRQQAEELSAAGCKMVRYDLKF